ncbi:hypothetical protein EYB25_007341 [Talaromyces marneffei]|uniref:Uncharacterized protein n=1 Tax=Talaromyces marneffei (strain ATCC 18224 / CBS 334.59 / QM 7333) TaxID=441960 RepID=B6QNA5_TALMQ|nr:uncharacterized protein EYB26_008478 [Talaromyces marneffei]EEA21393.1 conserved hypothetical protein [Talaromyces marneffei ATCC 18224]KAE8551107.1 hypothetical protein EYB25_007341 [Talaromyces marneffei]QGA20770.1 hypothetical protein EYB26_008478 [Talaromyces marneffei]
MPKGKPLLKELNNAKNKSKKKGRHQHADPETADEFLAAGVDQEEGGEKWRAGDPVKAMRFFMRAIEIYDNGLAKFPTSFDLAYNKARVQYEITQHPKLATQLPAPQIKILHIALQSHRHALVLDQDNADVLFNTAQVLTSLAEALTESKRANEGRIQEAMKYLNEALELFQRCLVVQELRYTESQEQIKMLEANETPQTSAEEPAAEEMDTESEAPPQEEWAAVVEPVTKDTLVDTAVAQLETLATLCGLLALDGGNGLAWVEEYSYDLLRTRIAAYVEGTDREQEVALARAIFVAALTEVLYRSGRADVETYQRELSGAFSPELDLSENPEGLCSKAEALTSFNSAIADNPPAGNMEEVQKSLVSRWQALTAALEALTTASKLASADNVPKIHIARGDAEMSRWRLGRPPWSYPVAGENAPTLLKNAQTYYRGAAALARRDGDSEQEKEGSCKEALAAALAGDKTKLDQLRSVDSEKVMGIAQEMIEDGLVGLDDAESLLM